MSENTEKVRGFLSEYEEILKSWLAYIEDPDYIQDERWEIFGIMSPYLDYLESSPDFDTLASPDWGDDLGIEYGDRTSYDEYFIERVQEYYDLDEDQIYDLKNEIMSQGYAGFILQ